MKIQISNGRVINPASGLDEIQDVFIAAGKIVGLGQGPAGFAPNRVIDARNKIVMPGLVDLAARLREPGFEYLATLESEMFAATVGGITSLACPPDTDPPLDEPGLVEMLKHRAKGRNQTNVHPLGALTQQLQGTRLTEMGELRDAGCVAFSQANTPVMDTQVLGRALDYASTFGFTVWLQPQDGYLARGGVAHDGEVASRLGLPAIPTCAETIAISTILHLVRHTRARVHLCRLSSAAGLDLVRAAKAEGLPVTCDISINHLHLSEHDIGFFNPHCRLVPPLRSLRDRDALRAGLADGTVDALVSDHSPVDAESKQVPFEAAEPGATGVELLLPLALQWARQDNIPLARALSRITADPSRILGVAAGQIAPGSTADLCIFNPDQEWVVTPRALKSQGKNTPFLNLPLLGRVSHTVVGGFLIYEDARA
ncbi:MAG: dihydroorotase [Betaproteobacteria bacterium]|nr:dihydroorotase [Betaproteobacteria bacterium]MDE2211405.1 dihydroorotase [Betaproteobacteria bacterium]